MSMITTVNEAINRKLASISFTDIIIGTVQSLEPLEIRINNRIVIGLSFIEPMSLGIDDNSPSSALPLTVGEKVQMIRYSNGQRFYILKNTIDYDKLYPIGTVYQNSNDTNPNEYFGLDWVLIGTQEVGGVTLYTWVREEAGDKILLEDGSGYLLMENGGKLLWQ